MLMRRLLIALCLPMLLGAARPPAAAAELQPFVRGSWRAILARHAGRPLVVHLWGLTCGPCRVEMPKWGEFVKERPDIDLVLIDADFVPNDPEAVAATLDKTGLANVESWVFGDGFLERLRYEIDPRWRGEIPQTYLIGRDGEVSSLEGVADLEKVRDWFDAQLRAGR